MSDRRAGRFGRGRAAAKAKAFYEKQWADGVASEPKGNVMKSDAKHFPCGYKKVAPQKA